MVKNILLFVWVLTLATACGSDKHYSALPAKASVVILGDSLTYGTGAGEGEDYASLLASHTDWNVINAGVPGNTSANGLDRLPALLAMHESGERKIDLLIIELGGNDFLKKVPEAETVANLKAILAQAKAQNIQTLMLAIPKFSPMGAAFSSLSDHELYEKIADETGVPLIQDLFSGVLGKYQLKADPIHPNAEGYQVVENALRQGLSELGFVQAR